MSEKSMISDKYYGSQAKGYEARRQGKPTWGKENRIIAEFVRSGTVLDVPIGTGRYIPHYQKQGIKYVGLDVSKDMIREALKKDPDLEYHIGSILEMPFEDGSFDHVVCTRLLNWLYAPDMKQAISEMRRIGSMATFSIRVGKEGHRAKRGTWTHARNKVLDALGGWMISRQAQISESHAGSYEMWQVRPPAWEDVLAQFEGRTGGPAGCIQKLAGDWAPRMGKEVPELGPHLPLTCEYWGHKKVKEILHKAAEADPAMITNKKPRRTDRPMVAFRIDDRYGLIDGRRRANLWQDQPGRYPVIIIHVG